MLIAFQCKLLGQNARIESALLLKKTVEEANLGLNQDTYKLASELKLKGISLLNDLDEERKNSDAVISAADAIKILLKKLDSEIIEGYVWQPVYSNVSPPLGTPNAASGMNPDAIKDPELKRQYLDNIEQNQLRNLQNRRQRDLHTARRSLLEKIARMDEWRTKAGMTVDESIIYFTNEGKSREILREMMKKPKK